MVTIKDIAAQVNDFSYPAQPRSVVLLYSRV